MSTTAALTGLKTAFSAINPVGQTAPTGVYVYPDDYDSMVYTVPFIVVSRVINRRFAWKPESFGLAGHQWQADIAICLETGFLDKLSEAKASELLLDSWLTAVGKVLFGNQGLGGVALALGNAGQLFDYQAGHIEWDEKVFWGLDVQVWVNQQEGLPFG